MTRPKNPETTYSSMTFAGVEAEGEERSSQLKSASRPRNIPLQQDTYDAALLALCFIEDSSTEMTFEVYFQFGFAWFLHFAVVGLQFMLVVFLFATVVEEAEDPYEHALGELMAEVKEALESSTVLDRNGPAMKLCRRDHTLRFVHMFVVLIWCSRMLKELRAAGDLAMVTLRLPTAHESIHEIIEVDSDGHITKETYDIVHMTMWLKVMVIVLIAGTRMVVGIFLTFTSAKYLILSNNMASVILKAVSMQFIVTLDELFCGAFIPSAFQNKIKATKIRLEGGRPSVLNQWMRSVAYVTLAILIAAGMKHLFFEEVSQFRDTCRQYYIKFPEERHMVMDTLKSLQDALQGSMHIGLPAKEL